SNLKKLPAYVINQVANQLNIPPVICEISSRTYDNYLSLISKYFKTSFSKKHIIKNLKHG
ncbi:TPA: hypothetical protein ACF2PW_003286, partial [Legionella pneumophila]